MITVRPTVASQHSPDQLWLEGHHAYKTGQLQQASQRWQQAAQLYSQQQQSTETALSLSYLALSYQELGQWQQAEKTIQRSLQLIEENETPAPVIAQVLNTYGSIQLALGQPEAALNTWQEATAVYQQIDDQVGALGSRLNQAQAMQTLGFYRRAKTLLDDLIESVEQQSDRQLKATALRSLGSVLQVTGSLEQSQQLLERSLAITQSLEQPNETVKTLLALANTLRAQQKSEEALQIYEQIMPLADQEADRMTAQLNLLSLLVELDQWPSARTIMADLSQQLPNLEPSRAAIYKRVNFVESALKFNRDKSSAISAVSMHHLADLLAEGAHQAQTLNDSRAESLALGELGQLYITTQQWDNARQVTQTAIKLAKSSHAKDIGYRWQWQLGKIYHQQHKEQRAISTYSEAIDTLSTVRADLLATNSELQFSIREKVEPLYRELVSLLLKPGNDDQASIKQARNLIEDLQLVELENYFRSACIEGQEEQIDQIDPQAAVVYPIILPDRLEVILALPNQTLSHYETPVPQAELEKTLDKFFIAFNPALPDRRRLDFSKQLYDWLIRPEEPELAQNGIKTLVFVLDGKLRNIPMAALHDGEKYLIENYGVALTPGLDLMGPHFDKSKPLEALILGVSESRQGFSPLPGVKEEVSKISSKLDQSRIYLDQDFTKKAFEDQVQTNRYPILHLATHGQFSSNLANTFLLAWDQTISLRDFDTLLKNRRLQTQNPIELMVLSACQTAEGDDRATLGLAGMAIKSGARSTLATLWSVNDESTVELINAFYNALGTSSEPATKAEALRQAQVALIKNKNYAHPFYWASFVLIGNWLA
ncbi:CHAT domain-containing protein [Leptothoe kymatousa]|uniref:CHAT domain-containing protein n=1 Tax=Leptothoe kymatousa TAU-MAC 1615 TaxID=2364775 RepID=A0ABS5Y2C3_9CYAN|nr:CHAT domain-containing protein [Leptothoe kymatousa]MBT9311653.1 CHAT domain-containing protein [Leptothoe kymatousa TAU-MAC 1615]